MRGLGPIRRGGLPLALLAAAPIACAATPSFDGTLYRGPDVAFRVSPLPASWRRVSDRDAPLVALTEHLLIGTTDRAIVREETIPFDAREARHTVLSARLDGVQMEYDIFILKKDGCVFDLVYVARPDAAKGAGGAAEFERFVLGFHTVGGPG